MTHFEIMVTRRKRISTKVRTQEIKGVPLFFKFNATLRIGGVGIDIDEISKKLGLAPTHSHLKGQKRSPYSEPWEQDQWSYQPAVESDEPLEKHILALWKAIHPNISYLRKLKKKFNVDIFCGYRSNSHTAGFVVDHKCLGLFSALDVPFGVSVIISCKGFTDTVFKSIEMNAPGRLKRGK